MPNKWTFTIKPIRQFILRYMADTKPWIDPFAGMYSPAHIRNDLNPEANAEYHMDALDFLRCLEDDIAAGVLFDPPYSPRQLKKQYGLITEDNHLMFNTDYFGKCKIEIGRILKVNGYVICCWWHSNGIGNSNGIELEEILLVPHGGSHNDTIVTVERKVQTTLE